jgi:pyruvate dehydrogenase E2 component (dihydrolipoamide acetyltransferase)
MDVKVPKLGEGADSGSVVSILVKDGEQIQQGQTIIELENEKAVAPIPAPASGTVSKIRVTVGDKISVGQVILTLAEGVEEKPHAKPEASAAAEKAPDQKGSERTEEDIAVEEEATPGEKAPETVDSEDKALPPETKGSGPPAAAPSIRKIARELGIDLRRIRGSERGGRIVMADLRAYLQRLQKLGTQPKPAQQQPAAAKAPSVDRVDFSKWGAITKMPLTPLRRTIGRRMLENRNTIPHVTQFDEADISALMELRKRFSPAYEANGARLTLTSFALKAVVTVLKQHPIFNTSLDETAGEIIFKEYYNIGLAVDTEAGLMVPVIRDVDKKSLLELSHEINDLAEKTRQRRISLEEMKGGTFTISNQGGIGGSHFTPIVNKPEVAILGLGRGALKPVVKNNKVEPRLMLPICLAYDHRVIDGGQAARFTVDLVQAFEEFKEEEVRGMETHGPDKN